MGFYGDTIFPHLARLAMKGRAFEDERRAALAGVFGDVLEIGFGAGLNYPFYPAGVRRLTALEPVARNERLFETDRPAGAIPVEFVVGVAERLPFADASFDVVVTTWTLCSVTDPVASLREIARVLRPGGRYVFVEHGLSSEPQVARWQRRLTPIQRRVACGCHLDRKIDELIASSGLVTARLQTGYMPGPKLATFLYRGEAVAPR